MKQKMNIWPRMTQHLNIFLQKCKQKHELWPFTKTNHSFISERELKYVKYFIRYYFLSFLLWSINVIVMEICPGRWNPILFVLVTRFNCYAMGKMDNVEINDPMEYFGCKFFSIAHWYYGWKFFQYHTHGI